MPTFAEGSNCFIMEYVEDWREIGTVIVLKGGKDGSGADIVVTVEDEDAIRKYGRRVLIFSEPQWKTSLLCELRALQLLSNYSKPSVTVRLDAEPEIINVGDAVAFKSSSMGVDDTFTAQSVSYEYTEDEKMILELTNRSVTLADLLSALQRQIERR